MASSLPEQNKWEPSIYQLEKDTPVLGGQGGPDNIQAEQLANRTVFLKDQLEAYNALIKSGELPFSSYADAVIALNAGKIPLNAKVSIRSENSSAWVEEYINQNGTLVPTGKKLPDGKMIAVSVFPTAEDPTGIETGLTLTTPGQTFRVLFDEPTGPKEVVYQNNGTSAIRIAEIASQSAMERLLMDAGILTESDPDYAIEFVDKLLRRAVGIAKNGRFEANAGMNISGVPVTELPADSDYCVLFRDARDRVAFGIGKTGFIEVNGMRVSVTEGDNLVEIVDSFQRVAGGIDGNGVIFSNTESTNGLNSKDSFMLFAELIHLFIYGQSLSNGAFGIPVLNTPVSNALMFNTGVRSNGKNPS
ncbi:hypothetical protein ACSTTF_25465, partial [Serratia marcescens]